MSDLIDIDDLFEKEFQENLKNLNNSTHIFYYTFIVQCVKETTVIKDNLKKVVLEFLTKKENLPIILENIEYCLMEIAKRNVK